MSRILAVSLLIALGLLTWGDAVVDLDPWSQVTSESAEDDGQVRAKTDCTGIPPN